MYYFSFHPNISDIGDHSRYSKKWSVKMFSTIYSLADACTKQLNAPAIWSCGIRRADNFLYADFLVIDIDDDSKLSLEQAIDRYSRFVHIIGTTKSHLLLKGQLVSARYRVFVALEKRITSAKEYKALCLQEAFFCGGDWQASGAAQHFMPLTRIVSYSEVGRKFPCTISPVRREPNRKVVEKTTDATYSGAKQIPDYIQSWLDGNVRQGERNITVFKAACGLKKWNFSEDEILEIVLSSSLPLDRSDKTVREVKATVRSAMRRK